MSKGGSNCQVKVPQSTGGVEVNSPHNNESNTKQLTAGLNQSRENAKYDKVGNRNVDNSAGPGGGGRRKKSKKRKMKTKFTRKKKTSQKSRRRKIYVGCKGRKRLGGKTKKLSGWGCMSGGKKKTKKRKTKKGGNLFSNITNRLSGKKEKQGEEREAIIKRPELFTNEEEEILNTGMNTGKYPREKYYGSIDDENSRERYATTQRPSKLTKEEEEKFEKKSEQKFRFDDKGNTVKIFDKDQPPSTVTQGGKRKTRKFKKHYMWNTKGKRYMAKTYKQHLRGKKLGHTHTKPKRKTRKTKKRKTRRRGGQAPGTPAYEEELKRRREAARKRRSGESDLTVLQDRDKRENAKKDAQKLMMKTMAGMEQQNNIEINKRKSLPSMPSEQFSTERRRAYTSGF